MFNSGNHADMAAAAAVGSGPLGLERKLERAREQEDEIAAGLLNVMLHRLCQQGRWAFAAADYKALRLATEAMMYLGTPAQADSIALHAAAQAAAEAQAARFQPTAQGTAQGTSAHHMLTITEEEQQALADAFAKAKEQQQ